MSNISDQLIMSGTLRLRIICLLPASQSLTVLITPTAKGSLYPHADGNQTERLLPALPGSLFYDSTLVRHFMKKKDSKRYCDTTTPESIHTKDESKRGSAFAFIFGVN